MRFIFFIMTIVIVAHSCNYSNGNNSKDNVDSILGSWKLISGMTIQQGDTTFTDYTVGQNAIKIINESHFTFFRHDLIKGKDSLAIFVAGAGKYSLIGDDYKEHLEFCNYREWEDHKFDFTIKLNHDTLTQTGIERVKELGVDRIITETYIKIK